MSTGSVAHEEDRIWEIDCLRFLAIVFMVTFHLIYDLNEFAGSILQYETGLWYYVGAFSAVLFIFISGISSGISRNTFRRGLKVLGYGMIITLITYLFDSSNYIRFGILHFLGISMMLFPLLKKINNWFLIIIGAFSFIAGKYIKGLTVNTAMLIPLGLTYGKFTTLDYYPLFPYISYFILGILCYKLFYYKGKSIFGFNINAGIVETISRNSLFIYLLHQPAMLGIIFLLQLVK